MECVQFLYDKSDVGLPMRSWLCLSFGTWHAYKQVCSVIWDHWSERVFAPLFHHLIPNANFRRSARLSSIATMMNYVRLAYPSFKEQLKRATRYHKRRSAAQDKVATSHLRDLRKLFEFFIPVVYVSQSFMFNILLCLYPGSRLWLLSEDG